MSWRFLHLNNIACICFLSAVLLAGCGSRQAATPAALQASAAAAPPAAALILPEGTLFSVRLAETLDTRTNRSGDHFKATLDEPVNVNDRVAIPKGATFTGRVDTSSASGRLKGRAVINLSLDSFEVNGKKYDIATNHAGRVSGS